MHQVPRSLVAAAVIAGLLTGVTAPRITIAQPVPAATPGTGSAATPAPGEDEALYSCKKRTGQVAVTFKPDTELKGLVYSLTPRTDDGERRWWMRPASLALVALGLTLALNLVFR